MTAPLEGQLDLLDLLPEGSPSLRIECPSCGSNWGVTLKPEVLARKEEEHREVRPGVCAYMLHLEELYAGLLRGEGWAYVVWTDESRAAHLASVRQSLALIWARRDAAVEAGRRWHPEPRDAPCCSDCGRASFTTYAGGYRDTAAGREYLELCESCSFESIARLRRRTTAVLETGPVRRDDELRYPGEHGELKEYEGRPDHTFLNRVYLATADNLEAVTDREDRAEDSSDVDGIAGIDQDLSPEGGIVSGWKRAAHGDGDQ